MWPFNRVQTKKLGSISENIPRKLIESLLTNDLDIPNMNKGMIDYLLFQVKDDGLSRVADCLSAGMEIVDVGGGVISASIPPIVLATFGFPAGGANGFDARRVAASTLIKHLGDSVKVVHGREEGLFGLVGGASRKCFVPILPAFEVAIEELRKLKFGEKYERGMAHF